MGTNYYFRKHKGNKCNHCGRGEEYEELHVGKSSMGWSFCFDSWYGEFKSFKDWKKLLEANPDKLYDEYNRNIPLKEFYEMVENKKDKMDLKEYYKKYPTAQMFETIEESEYFDEDGYRFNKHSEFS
jgi:hypothetical protein